MVKRIGISTGGGDAPGLNAVIRAVVKAATARGWEAFGIREGFDGVLAAESGGIVPLTTETVRGILPRGGTILGTTNRGNPFRQRILDPATGEERVVDRADEVVARCRDLGLDAVVMIGGDGTLNIGHNLMQRGLPVVGVPKTIDNDLGATEVTFGFDTALTTATEAIDKLHTTAESHHRVMVLEVMGRHAGWIALQAGIAGGGDIILLPEIPFRVEYVAQHIVRRGALGRHFSIIVAAEGATPEGGEPVYQPTTAGGGSAHRLGGVGNWLADALQGRVEHEIRVTVLGHLQRGGTPTPRDRILASRFGTRAVDLIEQGLLGYMVALRCDEIVPVPIPEAVARLKTVEPAGELVRTARDMGISFGDR